MKNNFIDKSNILSQGFLKKYYLDRIFILDYKIYFLKLYDILNHNLIRILIDIYFSVFYTTYFNEF